ncbi:hypothetical protein NDU88_008018 [Pleurodeles waltl]|uniref:Uncharacterized protein n=1 Tax=Pleurodeles waltl TaxID=8319 RepID=A0AAV7VU98_PLEWA|nr:hypothetical protein NDU88_008018 [Pleurodeles waltl]
MDQYAASDFVGVPRMVNADDLKTVQGPTIIHILAVIKSSSVTMQSNVMAHNMNLLQADVWKVMEHSFETEQRVTVLQVTLKALKTTVLTLGAQTQKLELRAEGAEAALFDDEVRRIWILSFSQNVSLVVHRMHLGVKKVSEFGLLEGFLQRVVYITYIR